jgi:ABC-type Mn2+/Zn2+ transport system permease subunit/Mn-dependent DtxR family transcriptional regulator
MISLLEPIIIPLQEAFFIKALIGGSMVAVVCGVIGCLVILRRMAFLGDALSHAMIAGVVGGYLFMKLLFGIEAYAPAMLVGSLIAAVLTVFLIGFVSRLSRIKEDTSIGIMYTGVFAAGVVMVSVFRNYVHIDIMHFIMGDVLGMADVDLWASAFTAALVLSVILLFFRYFQLSSFDPIMAASIGMPIVLIDYVLTTCVSLVVVSAVSMVGVILVVGLLITPAATAYLLSDRLDRMMILSAFFGLTSIIGGLYLGFWLDSSGGGAIMLFCTFQFLLVLFIAPKYGLLAKWIRLRQIIPQQLAEDIIGTVARYSPISPAQVRKFIPKHAKIHQAINSLISKGFLHMEDNRTLKLTSQGQEEARRIIRSHRLWEAYLQHVGIPNEEIHPKAHSLEHMHDPSTVEYIDDILGHPTQDPHGQEIPEDPACREPGAIVLLSQLRPGRKVKIVKTPPTGMGSELQPGEIILTGNRQNDGRIWVVENQKGEQIRLDHHAADTVTVECI